MPEQGVLLFALCGRSILGSGLFLRCPPEARSSMFPFRGRSAAAITLHRVPQVSHPSHLSSQPLRVELKHSCPVCPVSSLCGQAMAARCFADTGGLDSDDELADTGSQSAAAAAAAAHHPAMTAAASASSIQGPPSCESSTSCTTCSDQH